MTVQTKSCPYCGAACKIPTVDVGVGEQQSGPCGCENCGAVEVNPDVFFDADSGTFVEQPGGLTAEEAATGWKRGSP